MDNQFIGRRGEKRFDTLCSDANVTCNKSVEDDYGWDKLIEFPPRHVPFAAIDMQPGRTIACVQVKTTTGAALSTTISLSNAMHYARAPIPQFIVLVVLDGTNVRYFAKHVWTELIARWLKAGREADAAGITAINQERLAVSFTAKDEHTDDLLAWIEQEIGGIAAPYAATKKAIVDTVGFEKGRGSARMTLVLDDENHYLKIQLGLKPRVKATRFVYTSERFGIAAGRPEVDEQDVIVYMTPEGREGFLRLEFSDGNSVRLEAMLYQAEDGKTSALRAVSRVLDITYYSGHRIQAKAELNTDDRLSLEEMRAATLLRVKDGQSGVSVHIEFDHQSFDMGAIRMTEPTEDIGWSWMALALKVMRDTAIESNGAVPEVSLGELNDAVGDLEILAALASDRIVRIDHTPDDNMDLQVDGLLAYCSAQVGNSVYSVVARRPVGLDRTTRQRRQVMFGKGKIIWSQVAPSEGWKGDAVASAYRRHLDRQPADHQLMAVGDLAKMVRAKSQERDFRTDLPAGRTVPLLRASGRRKRRPQSGS